MDKDYYFVLTTLFSIDGSMFKASCLSCTEKTSNVPVLLNFGVGVRRGKMHCSTHVICFECVKQSPMADIMTTHITASTYKSLSQWVHCEVRHMHDIWKFETKVQDRLFERSIDLNILKALGRTDRTCYNCGKPASPFRCSGCQFFRFCGQACANQAWPWHKGICKYFKAMQTPFFNCLTI